MVEGEKGPGPSAGDEEAQARDFLRQRGYGVQEPNQYIPDMEAEFRDIWEDVKPYTMTSLERAYALYRALDYLLENQIPGDLVECGVWKGGSCRLMARLLLARGQRRRIHLYDTFSGMTAPTPEDRIAYTGQAVQERFVENWWAAGLEEVRQNLLETGYPAEFLDFVPGDVCQTLNDGGEHSGEQAAGRTPGPGGILGATLPETIALLRLDTDWYESTRVELEVLYPRLVSRGVMIIDDYGHFSGARQAVDEYWQGLETKPLLQRIDYTGRLVIKF